MMEQLVNLLIPTAYAESVLPPTQAQGGGMSFLVLMAVFVAFMYFFMWRPQAKRAKEQQALLASIAKGDEVITAGGLLGRISKVTDQYIEVSVAENIDIVMQKSAVVSVLPKGTIKSIG